MARLTILLHNEFIKSNHSKNMPQLTEFPHAKKRPDTRFPTIRTIVALMQREMISTYGRSPGGYIWAILEPVLAIAFLSIFFSLLLRSPSLGTNFPLFYASGALPFLFFNGVSAKIALSIRFSRQLLAYPKVTFIDAIMARLILNGVTQVVVFAIIINGIIVLYGLRLIIDYPSIILSFTMVFALSLGVGVFNCFLFAMLPLWDRVWNILTRPLFILSGVLFIPEDLPVTVREILIWNPLMHVVGIMRRGLFATYDASWASPVYVLGISFSLMLVGLIFLSRYHTIILNER